jgi:hypothetical protein
VRCSIIYYYCQDILHYINSGLHYLPHIIDGQHRLQAYREIYQEQKAKYVDIVIHVLILEWTFKNLVEMKEHFKTINKHVPVESYVINNLSNNNPKRVFDHLIVYIEKTYSLYLSNSTGCHFPNINLQQLKDVVHLIKPDITPTMDNIIQIFDQFNNECKLELENSSEKKPLDLLNKKIDREKKKGITLPPLYIGNKIKKLRKCL